MGHDKDDETRISALENALAEAEEALKAEQEARQAFVSLVTHELRVPMTSIKGYNDLLIKGIMGPVSDAQLGFLQTIRANVERMSKMVSDLSDINKIDGHRLPITPEPIDLFATIKEVVDSVDSTRKDKSLSLDIQTQDDGTSVLADRARLSQVLRNLLDNAMQYTPDGGHILVESTTVATDPHRICISVTDTGIGIPEEEQDRIFEMFFRASDEETRATPGNGLALHLSQRLMTLQDGDIGFESQCGHGSTFWVTLPVAHPG